MEILLGIDPGSRKTGFAAVRRDGRRLQVIDSGVFRLDARLSLAERLGRLAIALEELLARVRPESIAVEDVFSHRNARSALSLGQARGAALAALGRFGVPVAAYSPATVKRAVVGHGRADKRQIQRMVQVLLGLAETPREDEADALAVAICHAMACRQQRALAT